MARDVPFEQKPCTRCTAVGSFDFMGDSICLECYEALPDHDDCTPETCPDCFPANPASS